MTVSIMEPLMAAANMLREADKIPQYKAVLDAYQRIAELQVENHEQHTKIQDLKKELELIRADQVSAEGSQVWIDLLWIKEDENPYCLHCWEKQKRLYHVNKNLSAKGQVRVHCPECGSETMTLPTQSYWRWKERQKEKEENG
jgi:Zn finger protein HypA/HybF involved in hydrogenase expression